MSTLKPLLKENLNNPHGVSGYKLPRGSGKSRALLSRLTGMDCFDLEPGHIPEISIPTNEEPKNIYEELEELFVKQNEHIEEDKKKLNKWDNRFGNDLGYQGEIRLGKPGRKEFDKNGNPIHFVDSETFSSIKKQIGISEKAVEDNSLVEGIKNYHPNYIPPGLRPEYRSGGKL